LASTSKVCNSVGGGHPVQLRAFVRFWQGRKLSNGLLLDAGEVHILDVDICQRLERPSVTSALNAARRRILRKDYARNRKDKSG
jgi:hypothetical protein